MVSTRHEGDKVVISQWTCACVRIDLTPDEIEKVRAYLALNSVQI